MPIIYTNYSYNPMLIETAINILTDPIANMLTALLEYINLFNLYHNGNIKQIYVEAPILDVTLPYF